MKAFPLILAVLTLFCAGGCITEGKRSRPKDVPRFYGRTEDVLVIRSVDARPEEELTGGVADAWILRADPEGTSFGEFVGNGLNAFQAIPGYVLAEPDATPEQFKLFLELTVLHASSRWPTDVPRNSQRIPVESEVKIKYRFFYAGKLLGQGTVHKTPTPFLAPLNIIREDNVEKVVGDSLEFQYDKAVNAAMDELMYQLSGYWESILAKSR